MDEWGNTGSKGRYVSVEEITKDTVINNIRFYNLDGAWYSYDSSLQKLYSVCQDTVKLLFDFNGSGTLTPSRCLIQSYTSINYASKSGTYFGGQVNLKGFTYNYNWEHGDRYWADGLGFAESWYNSEYFGSSYTSTTKLWDAIIYTDSSFVHKTYNYPTQVQCVQNDLDGNNLSFYLSVNHNLSSADFKFSFIDKVFLTGFYKNGNDIVNIDTLIFSHPGTDYLLYKMDLPLDTFYLNNGYTFYYKATAKDKGLIPVYTSYPYTGYLSKTILSVNDKKELVSNFSLSQNYPNPFNPSTNIQYYIPSECRVNITVYNSLGAKIKELVNSNEAQGNYEVKFDGTGLASGIYFVTLKAASINGRESFTSSKKMILMK
jgi:hypothetical protein